MMNWIDRPPTHEEWLNAKNDGYWWVKFKLTDEDTGYDDFGAEMVYPEVWQKEVVMVTADGPSAIKNIMARVAKKPSVEVKLYAHGNILGKFDLDDESLIDKLWWQPVTPPND